ncbi:hypothetical protein L8S64_07285 [Enterobacter bugandensis]|uniref:hypothetical protein n=1 Tax=Enterobacter bugandensis TaxID=881260 RepID=UPI00200386AB|nr:hypothetical protein [Enterobacter bugandensis]MCK6643379.1 hypothetical protein [Enterobacter bugandensis]
MTNVSALEKIAEHMQRMEENSPRVAALQYSLKLVGEKMEEGEKRIAELEARCVALAAENAGLKQFPDQIVGFIGKLGSSEIGSETKEKIEAAAKKIKTPGTDAFLAEVRAQGVEMFAASLGSPYLERGEECYQDGYTHAIERIKCRKAPEFAAQLRKGVQS